jgi:putative membrane protein
MLAPFAVATDPSLLTVAYVVAGIAAGIASGLTPGLHANNFALVLAGIAPGLPGPRLAVAAAMLAAGVVHTFLDVVPALALGVPDAAMAATALPGHRLVLAGRGREALVLSALGSGGAVVLAIPLAVPVTRAMVAAYPTLRAHLPIVLAAIVAFLLLTEPTIRRAAVGALAFGASAALGAVVLPAGLSGPLPAGGPLAPLFAGLFGAPILLDAMDGAGVPPQTDARIQMPKVDLGLTALAGTGGGALVGYLPGVSAAVAAVIALPAVPGRSGARGFIVATSGANTATAIFALFALVALGSPRTGVLVAISAIDAPLDLPVLLAAVGVGAGVGFVLVVTIGRWYLDAVGSLDPRRLSLAVLGLLVLLSVLLAGGGGLAAFVAATAVGLIPQRGGTRRVHLMGVLIGPLALGL